MGGGRWGGRWFSDCGDGMHALGGCMTVCSRKDYMEVTYLDLL